MKNLFSHRIFSDPFRLFNLLFILALTGWSSGGRGAELTTLLTKSCGIHEGLIIHIADEQIEMLTLKGDYARIPQSELQAVLIHNVVENPIPKIKLTEPLIRLLVAVSMFDENEPRFIGWPVKFVEDLVIFYDLTGKTHVVEMEVISKIRPVQLSQKEVSMKSTFAPLSLGDLPTDCATAKNRTSGVRPSRILANQIHIEEMLVGLEKGFHALEGHQERTYLYPRPLMFDNQPRFGLISGGSGFQNPSDVLPIYFRWGSGKAFRFQSMYQLGGSTIEWLPNLEATTAFRSEVKSHLFHATLIAHLPSIAAGVSNFEYYKSGSNWEGTSYVSRPLKNSRLVSNSVYEDTEKALVMHTYNYMGLMGFDLRNWSISVGPFFPITLFYAQEAWREVLSNNMGSTLRIAYTNKYARFRVIGSTASNSSDSPNSKVISVNDLTYPSDTYPLRSFSSKFEFVRAGVDYQFEKEIKSSVDLVMIRTNYNEIGSNGKANSMNFDSQGTQFALSKRFGDYVSLGINYTVLTAKMSFDFTSADTHSKSSTKLGGFFEFIF